MRNVTKCVSVVQIKYRCIDISIYCCVLISKMFSLMDKGFEMTLLLKIARKGYVATIWYITFLEPYILEEIILVLSVS